MKAGIYQCYDGTLLYIAKDRTIKAFTSHLIHDEWTGEVLREPEDLITVTTAEREQLARFTHNNRMVEAKRLDNVPNGCTDHLRALSKAPYSMLFGPIADHGRARNPGEHLVDYIYAGCPSGGAMADLRENGRAMLRKKGFRICHKGSAKKHRKQGHYVIPLFDGTFAWRERTPAEREAVDAQRHAARTLRNMEVMTIGWPVGCGKTGVTQRG